MVYVDIPIAAPGDPGCWREIIENVYRVHWRIEGVERIGPAGDTLRIAYHDTAMPAAVMDAITAVSAEIGESHRRVPVEFVFARGDGAPGSGGEAVRQLVEQGVVRLTKDGRLQASGIFLRVMESLQGELRRYAADLGAEDYQYSTLLPLDVAQQCGIFDNQPQNVHFVAHVKYSMDGVGADLAALTRGEAGDQWGTRLARPQLILSPAVCYHYWGGGRTRGGGGRSSDVGTATGRCYRFEAPGLLGLERLREFTMWEVFGIGGPEETRARRLHGLDYLKDLLARLDLVGRVATASDPFFADVYARKRMFQVNMRLKHELQLWLPHTGMEIAVASVNDHRDFFTRAFGMAGDGEGGLHSWCMAFGLERFALAVLSQHGLEPASWPAGLSALVGRGSAR
jgi:hypothetical protein